MYDEQDLLDLFLSAASEELEESSEKGKTLKEVDIFKAEENVPNTTTCSNQNKSIVHSGETDSSDDEENKNYEGKYNESGREIKYLIESKHNSQYSPRLIDSKAKQSRSWKAKPSLIPHGVDTSIKKKCDIYTDPYFGIRIINPLISSVILEERMRGREAVSFSKLDRFIQSNVKESDWVIAGVVVNKSAVKTSQKGSQFSIWTLSDLRDDIKTVTLFLFSVAHSQLWKTVVGTVVGILNPRVMDRKSGSKDEASLSIDNAQKVMIFGTSKDFGTCKSVKKDGQKCTAIVNTNRCEFCIYHIKQEYQKCSQRSELQSNFVGRGLTALRNKVLGKNEVFYAGKSYTAIPASKSKKLEQKDNNRLDSLYGKASLKAGIVKATTKGDKGKKANAARLDVPHAQRLRDLELLKKLNYTSDLETKTAFNCIHSAKVTLEESKNVAKDVINELKAKNAKSKSEPNSLNVSTKVDANKSKNSNDKDVSVAETSVEDDIFIDNDFELQYDDDNAKIKSTSEHLNHKDSNQKIQLTVFNGSMSQMQEKSVCTAADSPKTAACTNLSSKFINKAVPVLSSGDKNNMIDFSKTFMPKHIQTAKLNAIKLIQNSGPIKKSDPNTCKSNRKRRISDVETTEKTIKKSKLAESGLISERFIKMMAATSKHQDLLHARDDEEKDKYFNKLEAKEQMEEKMANTFKLACKAVRCLKCKYTSFSASDFCKTEKHPLKVFDAMKRFFKCGNCGNRSVSLELIPTKPCNNCGSGRWERTGMMKEKLVTVTHNLSIRGGEQKFVNSVASDSNIDLLVPECD